MEHVKAVAKRISELLEETGYTQYKLFIKSGVPQATISTILKAEIKTIKMSTILDICSGFGIELSDFFKPDYFHLSSIGSE